MQGGNASEGLPGRDTTTAPPPARRPRRSRLVRRLEWAVPIAGVGLLCWFAYSRMPGQRLKRELARIKASGAPMTLAEAAPPPVPDDQNAAILYQKAFRLLPGEKEQDQLGSFISRRASASSRVPVSTVRQIVRRSEPALRLLDEAAQRPASRFPVDWGAEDPSEIALPHLGKMRACARLLLARALLKARAGDADSALRDVNAVLRMGRHVAAEPSIFSLLTSTTLTAISADTLNRAMDTAQPSATEVERTYATLRNTDYMQSFSRVTEAQRAEGLTLFDLARRNPEVLIGWVDPDHYHTPWERRAIGSIWRRVSSLDELAYLGAANRWVDLSHLPWRESHKDCDALDKKWEHPPKYAVLAVVILPVSGRASQARDRAVALNGLAQCAMALRAYQVATGHYPGSLAELRARVKWPLPADPFSGKDFVYHRVGKGYLIYSIGWDLKDDGGKDFRDVRLANPAATDRPADITWRMSR